MAYKKDRNSLSLFNLSFLDIMFCGFGAVVLLVLIVSSNTVRERGQKHKELLATVKRLKQEVEDQKMLLARKLNSLEEIERQVTKLQGRSEMVLNKIKKTERETASYLNVSLSQIKDRRQLESDLKRLDQERKRRLALQKLDNSRGRQALGLMGQGYRQYLTGLRLGGKRILILVDSSASMLASSIVSIVRLKNLPVSQRIGSKKWRRVIRTVKWLIANLPQESELKVALFNDRLKFLGDSASGWVKVSHTSALRKMVSELTAAVPDRGTSLYKAFSAAARLSPLPDNIILITDGLPTVGASRPSKGRVTSDERVRLFKRAVSRLPANIPVNTLLFPLEGDPMAPSLFWKLAVKTKGAFLTPSRDWP